MGDEAFGKDVAIAAYIQFNNELRTSGLGDGELPSRSDVRRLVADKTAWLYVNTCWPYVSMT